MGILGKLFGRKNAQREKPSNDKLSELLEGYALDPSKENYTEVINEIMNGNSFLIVPSVNDNPGKGEWSTLEKESTLQLTSVFNLDGLKVLGAFSNEQSLLEWTKGKSEYTAMYGKDVLDFCQVNGIDRIIIDSDQPTMFVMERNRENVTTETIKEETEVQVGTPINPISGDLLEKFKSNFSKVASILEVYQYAMSRNNENILVFAFRLTAYNDNSRTACINSIQNSMEGEKLDLPLELFFLDEESWYQTAKGIENALVYEK